MHVAVEATDACADPIQGDPFLTREVATRWKFCHGISGKLIWSWDVEPGVVPFLEDVE